MLPLTFITYLKFANKAFLGKYANFQQEKIGSIFPIIQKFLHDRWNKRNEEHQNCKLIQIRINVKEMPFSKSKIVIQNYV